MSAQAPLEASHGAQNPSKNYTFAMPVRPQYNTLPRRGPSSRKTGHATIHTDATEEHEAFESDAFAVHMPTTRLPIIDLPNSPAKMSPAAQAAAYQTYKEKARQVRERNNSLGVRVPSKIVSYDYASPKTTYRKASPEVAYRRAPFVKEVSEPLKSPTPAGSFPISPPLPKSEWTRPERAYRAPDQPQPRNVSSPGRLYIPRKTTVISSKAGTTNIRYHYSTDSEAGATRSTPSPTQPAPIRVRIKPRVLVSETQRIQTESKHTLYSRPCLSASPPLSRTPSPLKSMPNFTRHNSVEGDSLFGYRSKVLTGSGSSSSSDIEKADTKAPEIPTKVIPKRSLASRWPWLRPAGPRVAKPALAPVVMSNIAPRTAPVVTAPQTSTYVDPFIKHATPPNPTPASLRSLAAIRPSSPRKIERAAVPAPQSKFETGFAQIKHLTYILCKIGFILYGIIALWFVLDAVREAFHTIGAPFRLMKFLGGFVWLGLLWLAKFSVKMWERWGFKVALRGGWMWKMRWWQV